MVAGRYGDLLTAKPRAKGLVDILCKHLKAFIFCRKKREIGSATL